MYMYFKYRSTEKADGRCVVPKRCPPKTGPERDQPGPAEQHLAAARTAARHGEQDRRHLPAHRDHVFQATVSQQSEIC